jgi:hypothetical protein
MLVGGGDVNAERHGQPLDQRAGHAPGHWGQC